MKILVLLEDDLHAHEANLEILTGICAGLHKPESSRATTVQVKTVLAPTISGGKGRCLAGQMRPNLQHYRFVGAMSLHAN